MMRRPSEQGDREQGYILAGTIATLFAMSLVLATLVSVSSDGLRREKAAEVRVADQLVIKSAILLAAAQLAEDLRRRALKFDDGRATAVIGGRSVVLRVEWEALRLDINRAEPAEIDKALRQAEAPEALRTAVASKVAASRSGDKPIQLIEDLVSDSEGRACLDSLFTVFGGLAKLPESKTVFPIGQPAPGSVMRIEAKIADGKREASKTAIILMTGDPRAPYRMLDLRITPQASETPCHAE